MQTRPNGDQFARKLKNVYRLYTISSTIWKVEDVHVAVLTPHNLNRFVFPPSPNCLILHPSIGSYKTVAPSLPMSWLHTHRQKPITIIICNSLNSASDETWWDLTMSSEKLTKLCVTKSPSTFTSSSSQSSKSEWLTRGVNGQTIWIWVVEWERSWNLLTSPYICTPLYEDSIFMKKEAVGRHVNNPRLLTPNSTIYLSTGSGVYRKRSGQWVDADEPLGVVYKVWKWSACLLYEILPMTFVKRSFNFQTHMLLKHSWFNGSVCKMLLKITILFLV